MMPNADCLMPTLAAVEGKWETVMRGQRETFILRPNSALGHRQFILLVAFLGIISAVAGAAFAALGAWPVPIFSSLTMALVIQSLARSMAASQECETVTIDDERLVWTSVKPAQPARRLEFARCFVRVSLELDRRRDMVGRLLLQSAGRSHEIGRFLGGEERQAFAAALRAALEGGSR
jgi:uncharacterized membrane protein